MMRKIRLLSHSFFHVYKYSCVFLVGKQWIKNWRFYLDSVEILLTHTFIIYPQMYSGWSFGWWSGDISGSTWEDIHSSWSLCPNFTALSWSKSCCFKIVLFSQLIDSQFTHSCDSHSGEWEKDQHFFLWLLPIKDWHICHIKCYVSVKWHL